jgi:hypothetical protein
VAVTEALSTLTLQPSLAAHVNSTVFVPAFRCTGTDVSPQLSQFAVGGKSTVPALAAFAATLSVRACPPPLLYRTCRAYVPSEGTPVTVQLSEALTWP